MDLQLVYNTILIPWIIIGLFTFIILLYVTAPYGRFSQSSFGPMISSKMGWIIQESVSPIVFSFFFISGPEIKTPIMWVFFFIWVGHYFNRRFS